MRHLILKSIIVVLVFTNLSSAEPPVPYNYHIISAGNIQNEEQIWISPVDSSRIVAVWRDFQLGYRQVGRGSTPFGLEVWLRDLIPVSDQLQERQSDPTLTVDKNGNFYISVLDYDPFEDSSFIAWHVSTDSGATWNGPYPILPTVGPYFEDKQFITADRTNGTHSGNIYCAWARFPWPVKIMFSRSTTGATTWDTPMIIADSVNAPNCSLSGLDAGQFANPLVAKNGRVFVFWIGPDVDSTDCSINFSLKSTFSDDGGVSFGDPVVITRTYGNWEKVDGEVDVYNQPAVAADITDGINSGNLYVAYASRGMADLNWDIFFIRSTDNGVSWSDPIRINDDPVNSPVVYDQFHPWIFCNETDSTGRITAIWYDQRRDSVGHTYFDLYAAYSFDGGLSFSTNHRISQAFIIPSLLKSTDGESETDQSSQVDRNTPSRAGKIAEYISVSAFKEYIIACWTGTSDGDQDVLASSWELDQIVPQLPPRLLSPDDEEVVYGETISFDWAAAWDSNDDYNILYVSDDSTFATTVFVLGTNSTQSANLDTSFVPYGVDLYWKVRTVRQSKGDTTIFSPIRMFRFEPCTDFDGDAVCDPNDNCPFFGNPSQADSDLDGIGDACEFSSATPVGTNVAVSVGPVVDVTFDNVTTMGETEVEMSATGPAGTSSYTLMPSGFPTYYNITTTAVFADSVEVCINYGNTLAPSEESALVMLHFDGAIWVDVTSSKDTLANIICGKTVSLSTFTLATSDGCCDWPGDFNGDSANDIADLSGPTSMVAFMFQGGPPPPCAAEGDFNGDGAQDIADLSGPTSMVAFMFQGGPPPVCGP